MKSKGRDSTKRLRKLGQAEVQNAFEWIDSLSRKQIADFEKLVRIQTAQLLYKAYKSRKSSKRKKD